MPSQQNTPPVSFTAVVYQIITEQHLVSIDAGRIVQPPLPVLEQCARTCYVLYRQADNMSTPVERAVARLRAIRTGSATTPALLSRTAAQALLAQQRIARRCAHRTAILQHVF